jgi:hypothetical protein
MFTNRPDVPWLALLNAPMRVLLRSTPCNPLGVAEADTRASNQGTAVEKNIGGGIHLKSP